MAAKPDEQELTLLALIDAEYTRHPFYGSRKIKIYLRGLNSMHYCLDGGVHCSFLDCYSLAPIDKPGLLKAMQEKFGLRYEIAEATASVNATGSKPHYYSLSTRAADFGYQPALTSLQGIRNGRTFN